MNMDTQQLPTIVKQDNLFLINGFPILNDVLQKIIEILSSNKTLLLSGNPGLGKSYFCEKILGPLLKFLFGVEYLVIFCNLSKVRNPDEAFLYMGPVDDNKYDWRKTRYVKQIEVAIQQKQPVALVFEEIFSLSPPTASKLFVADNRN